MVFDLCLYKFAPHTLSNICTERIKYSGKVIDNETINFNNFNSKEEITTYLGEPNYIDPIENKYFYIHEKTVEKNFFDKELMVRNIVVASFDLEVNIIKLKILKSNILM